MAGAGSDGGAGEDGTGDLQQGEEESSKLDGKYSLRSHNALTCYCWVGPCAFFMVSGAGNIR